ncbi:MAG: GNAT family N-acetyltransferase [Dysgonomonas sp.]
MKNKSTLGTIIISPSGQTEGGILEDRLYEAIFQKDGEALFPREIINTLEINVFIDKFGSKKDDHCLVAELNDKIIGAVWVRILDGKVKGYGNLDSKTPEFAISLFKEYRSKGYGTMMMGKMIEYLKSKGYSQASLSVDKENYAAKMYKKLGFKIFRENEKDLVMVLKLI